MNVLSATVKIAAAAALATGVLTTVPAAQAVPCVSDAWVNPAADLCSGFTSTVGDKTLTILNFDKNPNNGFELELTFAGGFYDVTIDWFTEVIGGGVPDEGSDPINGLDGFIEYSLDITPAGVNAGYVFNTVALNQNAESPVIGGSQSVIKAFNGQELSVVSTGVDGPVDISGLELTSLLVVDSFSATGPERIVSNVNEFTQVIPAPASVLLFGAGLLGLGLIRRKRA